MFQRSYSEIASMSPGQIIRHHGKWADYNFPGKHDSLSGILEEMGEATHCLLKRFQGIRGFDEPSFFDSKFSDALADMVVFMLHHAYIHDLFLILEPEPHWQHFLVSHPTHRSCTISFLHELACAMAESNLRSKDAYLQLLYMNVWCMAKHESMDLPVILYSTLESVWRRDWQKDKVGAGGISAQEQANLDPTGYEESEGDPESVDMPDNANQILIGGDPDVPATDPYRNLARLEDGDAEAERIMLEERNLPTH